MAAGGGGPAGNGVRSQRAVAGALEFDLTCRRGGFDLTAQLSIAAAEVLVVVGPNGAGKTTLLRTLAGLERLSAGTIRLGPTVLEDAASGQRIPPERRPVGYVFQDYRLFPHLNVVDNVAFGLRLRGRGRAAARAEALRWLERVGLAGLAARRPETLSGGQAQRVALARALAPEPELLLLDEPLAALDSETRTAMRGELRRLVADYDGRCLLVTHDPLDAMVLGDRIAVLERGRVVQVGTAVEVAHYPRTGYVAGLVGLNLYHGRSEGGVVRLTGGGEFAVATGVTGAAFVAFPPTAVALYRAPAEGSPRNQWPVTVTDVEHLAGTIRIRLAGTPDVVAEVTPAALADLGLVAGSRVWASVKAVEIAVYPG